MRSPKLISVVLPVLDGEAHLAAQLEALAGQTYSGEWELVVADNGCKDRTLEIVRAWEPRLPRLTLADATRRRGLNHARNAGAAAAQGDFLVFCDADDVAAPGWLEAMAAAAPGADLVGGRLEWKTLNEPVVQSWRAQPPMTELVVGHDFLRYTPGGNMGVWTHVAREIGWDEEFTFGSSDHGFAWRAQLAGYRLVFAPDALMHQRFRDTLGSLARQHYRYGRSAALVHRSFADSGLPPPDNRQALAEWARLFETLPDLWRSRETRGRWVRRAATRLGRIEGSIRARQLCL